MSEPTKAELTCLDDSGLSITFQFNPTSFSFGRKVNWAEQNPALQPYTTLQYGNGASDTLSVSLFLDESESDESVLPYIEEFYKLTMPQSISSDVIRPPAVVFTWEEFKFQGVVNQLDVEITLFDDTGAAKRATVSLGLLGHAFPEASSVTDFFGQAYEF